MTTAEALLTEAAEHIGPGEPDRQRLADLGPGDTLTFAGPPHDVHRQEALGDDAVELLLLGRDPRALPRVVYSPAVSFRDTIVGCLQRGDRAGLVARYRPDALGLLDPATIARQVVEAPMVRP